MEPLLLGHERERRHGEVILRMDVIADPNLASYDYSSAL